MFDTFKKDISVGDRIKLHLTNSSDKPEGTILEIGEDYVLLENNDGTKSHFSEKLIGGWDFFMKKSVKEEIPESKTIDKAAPASFSVPKSPIIKPSGVTVPQNVGRQPAIQNQVESNTNRSPSSFLEREIFTLIKEGNYQVAMQKLDNNLKKPGIEDKYKSSFLLKKAQIYSTLREPENSENTYKELIAFNENSHELKINTSALSHYCTELARLQAQTQEKLPLALETVKKALGYNNRNVYATNLLHRLESITSPVGPSEKPTDGIEKSQEEGDLLVETGDNINEISAMLKIDFEEHKYANPLIIKNGGVPTPYIADMLVEQARTSRKDIGERYLLNLDAAKAYQELSPGSYELSKYLAAAAAYALFKGDLLYNKFKNEVLENNTTLDELIRMKDSACSYYLESAKLLSAIIPDSLLNILTKYLILNVVLHFRKNGDTITEDNFKGQFSGIVKYCLTNKDRELEKIVWITFVELGASSSLAWNELTKLPGGTGNLYGEFTNLTNRYRIYNLINSIWGWESIDISLKPGEFLREAFKERQKLENEFAKSINSIRKNTFEGEKIDQIIQSWSIVSKYENLLTTTDRETEKSIDNALEIARPYLKRNPVERTNILIIIQNIIEKQIDFINRNTTIYGRTYFFPLLAKWKKDIGSLLNERIVESRPQLKVAVDPPYYYENKDNIFIPLIIVNEGETTSESCVICGTVKSIKGEAPVHHFKKELRVEIAAGSKTETRIDAPLELARHSQFIKLNIDVEAKYQNEVMAARNFKFTLGKETDSNLTLEDIPWTEGKLPVAQLFKGREAVLDMLCKHYCSLGREKPYILYGLTRTGKSSILTYLKEKIEGLPVHIQGNQKTIVTMEWNLQEAANYKASEFWEYIILEQGYYNLRQDIRNNIRNNTKSIFNYETKKEVRFKDFQILIECFNGAGYYPLFLVDEFSYIKSLIDRNVIQPAFLAVLRQLSLGEQAGFLFAGTYDIKDLIENKEYGITGQLVHAINYQIDKIDDPSAEELITVLKELTFTQEAISHIKKLSGNIPYFIQIICKYCGYYAVENKRHSIGYPELEGVIRILSGLDSSGNTSPLQKLPDNIFQNNQFAPGDPPIVPALISSIAWLNRDRLSDPYGVRMSELQKFWSDHSVNAPRPKLADAIKILLDKKIITSEEDDGDTVYRISVDLFRRWWYCHHPDIKLELASISE
jgi:hypothetical protein